MSTPVNHWKIGLFVVSGIVLTLCSIVYLGTQTLRKQVVNYETYFDESVQGLEIGSPVKFRGVTIGNVAEIFVAPDHRHVGVKSALVVKALQNLGLSEGSGKETRIRIPSDVRAQLASQGITGVKFLQVDFFDEKSNPPPQLPFKVDDNYLPAAVSVMKNLEDAILHVGDRLPEIADNISRITGRIDGIIAELEQNKIPEKAAVVLVRAAEALSSANGAVKQLETGKISGLAQENLATLNQAIKRTNQLIARLDSQGGLLTRAETSTSAFGEAATSVKGLGQEVEDTLRDIQELTSALRHVAEALERDPDMLLKGRGKR